MANQESGAVPQDVFATESELCYAVLDLDADMEEDVQCASRDALAADLVWFEASYGGDVTSFVAQREGEGWRVVAHLDTNYEGRSNMSGWLDRIRARSTGPSLAIEFRSRQTDWDIGDRSYSDHTTCRRIRCTRGAQGRIACDPPATLVARGGHYAVIDTAPNANNWPYDVGAPQEQWDCRSDRLAP